MREVAKARKSSSLEVDIKDKMTPKTSILPCIYRLPKNDKGMLVRSVLKCYRCPDLPASKFLGQITQISGEPTSSFLRGSTHFVRSMDNLKVEEGDILITFIVVSIFTRVPVDDAIEIIERFIEKDTTSLVKICLKSTYYIFRGIFSYKQNGT